MTVDIENIEKRGELAYRVGYDAAHNCEPRAANPYRSGTWEYEGWHNGYDQERTNMEARDRAQEADAFAADNERQYN